MDRVIATLIVCVGLAGVCSGVNLPTPVPHTSNAEISPTISLHSIPQLLASIDERLRGLDTLYSSRLAPAPPVVSSSATSRVWDNTAGLEPLGRRLEAMEARLGRLDALLELRIEKLPEALSGRHMKAELALEQLSRKLDGAIERLSHRLGYLEAHIDAASNKVNARVDTLIADVQRVSNAEQWPSHACCHQLKVAVSGSENRVRATVERVGTAVQMLRESQQNAQSDSGGSMVRWDYLQQEHANNLSRALKDVIKSGRDKMLESFDLEARSVIQKMTGMYNELWLRAQGVEELVKQSIAVGNATQWEVMEALRRLTYPAPISRTEDLHRLVMEVGRRLDSGFSSLSIAQNTYNENYRRMQQKTPQLEEKLALVLERMLNDTIQRSAAFSMEFKVLQDVVKSEGEHLSSIVTEARDAVMQMSQQSVRDNKGVALNLERLGQALQNDLHLLKAEVKDKYESSGDTIATLVIEQLKPVLLHYKGHPHVSHPPPTINETLTLPSLKENTTTNVESNETESITPETKVLKPFEVDEIVPELDQPEFNTTESLSPPEELRQDPGMEETLIISEEQERQIMDLWKTLGGNYTLPELLQLMLTKDEATQPHNSDYDSTEETSDYMGALEPTND